MFNFGAHLKAMRKSMGITQKQLAIDINASERGIQQYELGERRPTFDMLVALADYFDVPVGYLMGNKGTNLTKANLERADMREVKACGAIFVRANLTNTDLRNADLRYADFSFANLRGAKLDGAKLTGAIFTGADVSGTILDGKIVNGSFVG